MPGTSVERPNWRRKFRLTLDEIHGPRGDPSAPRALLREKSRRAVSNRPVRSEPIASLSEMDLFLFNEGTHRQIQDRLGAHPGTLDGAHGHVLLHVGAERRASVHVVGDFNGWTARDTPLFVRRRLGRLGSASCRASARAISTSST